MLVRSTISLSSLWGAAPAGGSASPPAAVLGQARVSSPARRTSTSTPCDSSGTPTWRERSISADGGSRSGGEGPQGPIYLQEEKVLVLYLQEEKVLVHLGAEEERGTESWVLDTGFTNAKLNLRSIGGSRPSGRIGDTRTTSCLLLFVSSPRPPHIIGISSSGRPYPHSSCLFIFASLLLAAATIFFCQSPGSLRRSSRFGSSEAPCYCGGKRRPGQELVAPGKAGSYRQPSWRLQRQAGAAPVLNFSSLFFFFCLYFFA